METVSFAISSGEGTLVAYGTLSPELFNDLMTLVQLAPNARSLTVIIGAGDGTGE